MINLACSGDSGGPLVVDKRKLIGVVSFGSSSCASTSTANAFARVSAFASWLESKKSSNPLVQYTAA